MLWTCPRVRVIPWIMENENSTPTQLRYCLYARKSSEADEKQAMSIDSQINEMTQLAQKEKLEIVETIRESKSAKSSGQRMGYNSLILGLKEQRFNAILTWAPDRLSRNAGDLGTLVDLMDEGGLIKIRTSGQTFTNTPDEKFLLMILCSQAKLENDNRSKNVKRGMRAKCQTGIRPGLPPIGYYLQRGEKFSDISTIEIDRERAPYIKKIFKLVAHENMSGRQVWDHLRQENFRTKNNKLLSLSMIYRILGDTFYYGKFEYPKGSGSWYDGVHTPLITKKMYDLAQTKLVVSPKGKWGRKQFYFNKIFKCGVCGSGVCGETHLNRHGKEYTYYKCNRYYGYGTCKERYITEAKLIEQVAKIVEQVSAESFQASREIEHEVDKINQMERLRYGEKARIMTTHEYLCFLLKNGNAKEKEQVLRCIKGQLVLERGEVKLQK